MIQKVALEAIDELHKLAIHLKLTHCNLTRIG